MPCPTSWRGSFDPKEVRMSSIRRGRGDPACPGRLPARYSILSVPCQRMVAKCVGVQPCLSAGKASGSWPSGVRERRRCLPFAFRPCRIPSTSTCPRPASPSTHPRRARRPSEVLSSIRENTQADSPLPLKPTPFLPCLLLQHTSPAHRLSPSPRHVPVQLLPSPQLNGG